MLLPAIVAIGGALIIDALHYNDGHSLMRRTPHWWRMLLHMFLYISAVCTALVVNWIAAFGYNRLFTKRRRLTILFLNLAALPAAWYVCQPRSCYYAGLGSGYEKLDHVKLESECATMPRLIAQAPHARDYLLLKSGDAGCKKWWDLLPPYVTSLDPDRIYVEPDRVVLVLDPAFIEAGTGDNGLYVPLADSARVASSPNLRPISGSSILRLENHQWERFRSDKSQYAVFPYVPTPVREPVPTTRPARDTRKKDARASGSGID